jgi:hypothetical protein
VGCTAWFGSPFWSPQIASSLYPAGILGGGDDITNFYERPLGVTSQ